MGKWALASTELSLTYVSLKAMKAKVIADFLANYFVDSDDDFEQDYICLSSWKLYFDDSCHGKGGRNC